MSKIENGGLDQYGAGSFRQQQFGTAGVEAVNAGRQNNFSDIEHVGKYSLAAISF